MPLYSPPVASGGVTSAYTLIPAPGTAIYRFNHNLNRLAVVASIRREAVVNGVPVGEVGIRWWPVDANNIDIDFDTYVRVANEFSVTVK